MTRYETQSEAKAAAQSAANRLGLVMYVAKVGSRYEVSHVASDRCIAIVPQR